MANLDLSAYLPSGTTLDTTQRTNIWNALNAIRTTLLGADGSTSPTLAEDNLHEDTNFPGAMIASGAIEGAGIGTSDFNSDLAPIDGRGIANDAVAAAGIATGAITMRHFDTDPNSPGSAQVLIAPANKFGRLQGRKSVVVGVGTDNGTATVTYATDADIAPGGSWSATPTVKRVRLTCVEDSSAAWFSAGTYVARPRVATTDPGNTTMSIVVELFSPTAAYAPVNAAGNLTFKVDWVVELIYG